MPVRMFHRLAASLLSRRFLSNSSIHFVSFGFKRIFLTPSANKIYFAAGILILLTVSALLYKKPYYNWDMFPYMALAAQNSTTPFDSTHLQIYREAALNMPQHDFDAISQRQPELMKDPNAFKSILKYFEIKPAYNLAVRLIHSVGFNLVTATYLPSIISYFLIGCVTLLWMQKIVPSPFSVVASLAIMASPFLVTTSRYSSPDMLCAVVALLGLFIMLESSVMIGLIVSLIAITVRPDAVILYLFVIFAFQRTGRLSSATASTFRVLAVLITIFTLKGPDLLMEYLFTNTTQGNGSLIQNYIDGLSNGLNSILDSQLPLFVLIAIVTLFLMKRSGIHLTKDVWSLLILATIGTFIVRFFLHPDVEDRFFIACYLIIILGLCKIMAILFLSKAKTS
jgi:hypothetical protein